MIYVIQLEHNHKLPTAVENLVSEYLIKQLADTRVPEFESLQDETVFSFQYLHGADAGKPSERVIVSLRDNDIVFLCRTAKTREALIVMTEEGLGPAPADAAIANPDKVLQLFFSEMIRKDFEYLEKLEDRITETENALIMTGDINARTKIIDFRKELRRLKKYAESLDRILQGLYENENNLMTEEMQSRFRMLNRKMDRLLSEVHSLHEYVSQLREAYQAQIDIEQNNLMKVFTIVATIFMPLTLLVGWYGMNLRMPEYGTDIAYPIVAAISVLIFVGGIFYFKKKKWL